MFRPFDVEEDQIITKFTESGCGCSAHSGRPYSTQFTVDYIKVTRLTLRELSKSELDCAVMGQLLAHSNTSVIVVTIERKHKPAQRVRQQQTFFNQGKKIFK